MKYKCTKTSSRDVLDGYVINDMLGKYTKLKLYNLVFPDYDIPNCSLINLLATQTKTLFTKAGRGKIKNDMKCRKDYMRVKYLCTLLYNNLLPEDNARKFLDECEQSYRLPLENKSTVSRCTNIRDIPFYSVKDEPERHEIGTVTRGIK